VSVIKVYVWVVDTRVNVTYGIQTKVITLDTHTNKSVAPGIHRTAKFIWNQWVSLFRCWWVKHNRRK